MKNKFLLISFVLFISCGNNNSTPEGLAKNLLYQINNKTVDYSREFSPNKKNYKEQLKNQINSDLELEIMATLTVACLRGSINIFRELYRSETGEVNLKYHNSSLQVNPSENSSNILQIEFRVNEKIELLEVPITMFESWKIMDYFRYDPNLNKIKNISKLVNEDKIYKLYPTPIKLDELSRCIEKTMSKYAGLEVLEYKISEIYSLMDSNRKEYYYIRYKSEMADNSEIIKYNLSSGELEQL